MEQQNNDSEMRLCNNCKSFYGTQNTNFLCSKCFKEQQDAEKQEVEATTPIKELVKEVAEAVSPKPKLPEQQNLANAEEAKEPAQPSVDPVPVEKGDSEMKDEETKEEAQEEVKEEAPKIQENKGKCWHCGRKVGLVQTECKCGYVYCPKHRHAEAHNCTFDYHQQQKTLLEKNNPVIAHQKMEKMF